MLARPGPAYKPEDWRRGYSHEQIVAHLSEAIDVYREIADAHDLDAEIRPLVFNVALTMVAAVEPTEEALKKLGARQQILGTPDNGAAGGIERLIGRG